MRKLLILTLSALWLLPLSAQTTAWPYEFPEFREGTIYLKGGQKDVQKVNLHLAQGRIHYIDDKGVVRELSTSNVIFVEAGNDKFMVVNGDAMKVAGSVGDGFVAVHNHIDFQRMSETGGAYGTSSSSSSTTRLASVETAGVNMTHMELLQNKENGEELVLATEYYIVTGGKVYEADRKSIEQEIPSAKREEFKTFLKSHKIKWNDTGSLLLLVDFLKNVE